MRDLMNEVHPVRCISPVSVADNTAQTSQAVDLQGYDSCTFLIATGSLADADATFAVEVQECDTSGGTYTAVADADLVGTEALAGFQFDDDNEVRKVGYRGSKRYVKLVITPANNASAGLMCAIALLGHAYKSPTPNPPV